MRLHNRLAVSVLYEISKAEEQPWTDTNLALQSGTIFRGLNPFLTVSETLNSVSSAPIKRKGHLCPLTHSVKSRPGNTALTLIFGPCVVARHFMR